MEALLKQVITFLRAMWKHRWWGLLVAWLVAVGGGVYVYTMPNQFEAYARVFVDTQTLLKPLMAGLAIQPNIDQQVAMMNRTLISRPNVEKVVRMADLDLKTKTSQERDALVDQLMGSIRLGGGGDNIYTIRLRDPDPNAAKKVVQSLLTIFVEGSLGDKRKDSQQAMRFVDEQIKAYEQKLAAAEQQMREFRAKHRQILLGGSERDYFTRMNDAAEQVRQAQSELRQAENSRDAIKRQLEDEGSLASMSLLAEAESRAAARTPARAPTTERPIATPELDARIGSLRGNLDGLLLKYTEQHPDVVNTRRLIARLEDQKREEIETRRAAAAAAAAAEAARLAALPKESPRRTPTSEMNPVVQQLKISLADSEARIASLRARVSDYERRYAEFSRLASTVPQIEGEMASMNRDYGIQKRNYETLLARRESAQLGGEMETSASMVDFRVIDPPRVTPRPVAPNRLMMLTMAFLGALAAGIATTFVISQLRPTFSDRASLRAATSLPVLGSVTMVWTPAQRSRYRQRLAGFFATLSALVAAYGGVMAFIFLTGRTA